MSQLINLPNFLTFFAFAMGATIGSFLNVCIYRMPLGQSVNDPKRSFCPSCKYQIPWYHNLPLVTWLILRGKCNNCQSRISIRYWFVELGTAIVFVVIWRHFVTVEHILPVGGQVQTGFAYSVIGWPVALCYWLFACGLIVATFVDFEHKMIPDEITIGGTVVGILLASIVGWFAIPHLTELGRDGWMPFARELGADVPRWQGAMRSVIGAAVGFGSLYAVVVLGKMAFGRKSTNYDTPQSWEITQEEGADNPMLTIGNKKEPWEDVFMVTSEKVKMNTSEVILNGVKSVNVETILECEQVTIDGKVTPLGELKTITGTTSNKVYFRDAMGFGDVKFLAMIGAFLGWQAVLFTIFLGSVAGTLVAVPLRLMGRADWSTKIPFGPYLALGGVVWLFWGTDLMTWYFGLMQPGS
ncbi:MAG: leader peptidase (prepilin peptidase)/N-methyltransferase [Pseudoalteromonas tetraodonis]|jgi:leader peptidase (prepilin peptidase)/N-methyltransferase